MARSGKSSSRLKDVVWAVLLVMGLVAMLYPLVSTMVNNRYLAKVAEETETEVLRLPDDQRDELWGEMVEYNRLLAKKPFSPGVSEGLVSEQDYFEAGAIPGRDELSQVVIPAIDVSLPVYRGTTQDVLRRGAGHMFGTSLPVGGEGAVTAISAHTGMVNATMFDNLSKLEVGDAVYLSTLSRKLKYEVEDLRVVPPDDVEAIPTPGLEGDHVFLITCTPYGLNTDRLVVQAKRVPIEQPAPNLVDMSNSVSGWKWWMWVSLFAAVGVVLLVVWSGVRARLRRREG